MPQLHTKLSESERQRMVDEVLEKLEREGYLERVPGKVDPVEGQAWRWPKSGRLAQPRPLAEFEAGTRYQLGYMHAYEELRRLLDPSGYDRRRVH